MSAALHIEEQGSGPRVSLLHGWGMNLRVFDPLRERLAHSLSVRLVDLPGHGRSAWCEDWSEARQRSLLAEALLPADTLLGWSLGGQIALSLALASRQTAAAPRRLVLLATTPRFLEADDWSAGLSRETLQHFARSLEQHPADTIAEFLGLQVRGSQHAAQTAQRLRAALDAQGTAQLPALRAGLTMLALTDLRDRLASLELPTLVIGGMNDRVTPPAALQALARALPRAQLLLLPRAGHAPFVSHADAVAEAVLGFIGAGATT
ncbi:MAG TPA: alpha/beta fold hydrolase [Steroidobacteraceae bacterium]|jgi:pimeloyl-[acyl-carrier protein] methyl ester esterase|nr:alpha/beta fold hydrolase [Steroidobacteraceae bacterium]